MKTLNLPGLETLKIVIVEAGPSAGLTHIKNWIACGVQERQIFVIENDWSRIAEVKKQWPGITINPLPLLEAIIDDSDHEDNARFWSQFKRASTIVDITSMTPGYIGHYDAIEIFVNDGFRHILCEKPLTMNNDESERLQRLLAQTKTRTGVMPNIYTALLLPFSPAVTALLERVQASNLQLTSIDSTFTKDRRKEATQRACHGVGHDLIVHNIALAVYVINQLYQQSQFKKTAVGTCDYTPFVQEDLQQAAHDACESIPLLPVSSMAGTVSYGDIQHTVVTSFVAEPKRNTSFVFQDVKGNTVEASVSFDVRQSEAAGGGISDIVEFKKIVGHVDGFSLEPIMGHQVNKVAELFIAVLQSVLTGENQDPRLLTVDQSLEVIAIIDAITRSNDNKVSF